MASKVTLKSDLGKIAREAQPLAAIVVEKTARDIEGGAQIRTPPKVDTGALMGAWASREVGDLEWEAYNPMDYAEAVEHGSTHPPVATRGKDGGDVTREYTIPAHPMIVPAAEEAKPGFIAAMRQVFER